MGKYDDDWGGEGILRKRGVGWVVGGGDGMDGQKTPDELASRTHEVWDGRRGNTPTREHKPVQLLVRQ